MVIDNPTRMKILQLVKRQPRNVEELAALLAISPTAVRQHIKILERSQFLTKTLRKTPLGRPTYEFSITDSAEQIIFPKRYQQLADALLAEINVILPLEQRKAMFERIGSKMVDVCIIRNTSGQDLLTNVVSALKNFGGDIEVKQISSKEYEVINYNCAFAFLSTQYPEICQIHDTFIERAFGKVARVKHAAYFKDNHQYCTMHIAIN